MKKVFAEFHVKLNSGDTGREVALNTRS